MHREEDKIYSNEASERRQKHNTTNKMKTKLENGDKTGYKTCSMYVCMCIVESRDDDVTPRAVRID